MPQFLIDPKNEAVMQLLRALAEFQPGVNDLRSMVVFFTASAETAALVNTFDDVTPVTDFRAVAGIPASVSTETPAEPKPRKKPGRKPKNGTPPASAAAEEPSLADPVLAAALDEIADDAGLPDAPPPAPERACSKCGKALKPNESGTCKRCSNKAYREKRAAREAAEAELSTALDHLVVVDADPDPDPASLITGKRAFGIHKHPAQVPLKPDINQRIDEIVRQDQARQQGQPVPSPKPIQAKGRFGVARKAA